MPIKIGGLVVACVTRKMTIVLQMSNIPRHWGKTAMTQTLDRNGRKALPKIILLGQLLRKN